MYISSRTNRKNKPFKTNETSRRIRQKFIYQFDLAKNLNKDEEKELFKTERNKNPIYITMDQDTNDDFLFSFWKKFDDVFKKLEGNEKIFEELKKRSQKMRLPVDLSQSTIYSRKMNFPKKKIVKPQKIDVNKIVEIQKIFKGHSIRKLNINIDRLRLRQCLVELFCLLLLGHWCRSQVRYNFYLFKEYYITAKLYAGDEISFMDRISFKLSSCYYHISRINDLKSNKLGEDLKSDEE